MRRRPWPLTDTKARTRGGGVRSGLPDICRIAVAFHGLKARLPDSFATSAAAFLTDPTRRCSVVVDVFISCCFRRCVHELLVTGHALTEFIRMACARFCERGDAGQSALNACHTSPQMVFRSSGVRVAASPAESIPSLSTVRAFSAYCRRVFAKRQSRSRGAHPPCTWKRRLHLPPRHRRA